MKHFKFRSQLVVGQNFFIKRVVNAWNSLPNDVVCATTVSGFKKRFDDFWVGLSQLCFENCLLCF